ncbi:phage tail tube protein [Parasedimentitalea psychrophila]|uniref:Phage tail tube protein n=1 Tax=Parasedimentitalea psychrophila TaxID=2997337 RepID=A0A9Y2KUE9_9RHOB|nr:phage tail tube protein [Parasedimentitalea psychrophila]WIY23351.1 phage tail tube protein [Parasedimentitalea psychrophila]
MSELDADIGYNSTFGMADVEIGPFPAIAGVISITPPSKSREAVDKTHLKSPDRYKEYFPGMKEGGEAKIGLNFAPSVAAALDAAFEVGETWFRITFPDETTTLTSKAVITGLEYGELVNDKMTATLTVKPSGKPVLAVV